MTFERFIGHVQHRAHLASQEEALRATRATLATLAERLPPEHVRKVAAQLPVEIGRFMTETPDTSERFDFHEFIERVSEREHVGKPDATYHARCVLEVVREAISVGSETTIRDALPVELERLFVSGSQGRLH